MVRLVLVELAVVAACSLTAAPASAGFDSGYLINGSFETGDLTGWILHGNLEHPCCPSLVVERAGTYYGQPEAVDGSYYGSGWFFSPLSEGPLGPIFLSQAFVDTPGETLHITGFALSRYNGLSPNPPGRPSHSSVSFIFNGQQVGDVVARYGWGMGDFYVTATGFDTFTVSTIGLEDEIYLDALRVAPVPEPSTWALLIGGLALAGVALRRRGAGAATA